MQLTQFYSDHLYDASLTFFKGLNMPVKELGKQPYDAQQLLDDKFLPNNEAHQLLNDIYLVGLIDDDAFQGIEKGKIEEIENYKEYDGILVLAVELKDRPNNLLPTRTHLSQLTRAFNRKFPTTPAVIIYRYDQYIAFANVERLAYKQEWKQAEGEKAGKVSLLRDVNIEQPHTGHLKILEGIKITRTGKKGINNLDALYKHWQEVFSVSILSKAFYEELFHWYLWAIQNVTFPNKPTLESVVKEYGKIDDNKLEELLQEHKAKNIIRLLTRLLFVWFIKEKGLIPKELFNLNDLQKDILKNISPYKQVGLLKETNNESIFYKAILQNLFFAALNCPIDATREAGDTRKRGFRDNNSYGQHRGVDYLMRYERYFQNPKKFLELLNNKVPFLNGGLFECLDEKENSKYIDGFSDNMKKGEQLIVPDFLFFGDADTANLSKELGIKKKGIEKAAVKGLVGILKSYKFTIAENTPIEEDIALDPELLGKVFENLLASYNPETKTTARKQTGSFYTPREIVDYMVDESLIASLKTKILDGKKWQGTDVLLEQNLHQLFSYDDLNPFADDETTTLEIINGLDACKILDPACGSGAFPMGVLQKMVHVLGKLDKGNIHWRKKQINKVRQRMQDEDLTKADLKEIREQLIDIEKAFDDNDSDYARKLFLIENCIYGVDIQPIATQISKLRFFISLIVDQNVAKDKQEENFGIRPLPNLETKFVTANTLIGIEKPDSQLSLFETTEVKELETELKRVRHKIFSAKSKETKTKYKLEDERLRGEIADKLVEIGWATTTATQLAKWNPFDQNYVAPFFDGEWMFGINDGFDIVIGNPPYVLLQERVKDKFDLDKIKKEYSVASYKVDLYHLFFEKGIEQLNETGKLIYITPTNFMFNNYADALRKVLIKSSLSKVTIVKNSVFDACVDTTISLINKERKKQKEIKFFYSWHNGKSFDLKFKSNISLKNIKENDFAINPELDQSTMEIINKLLDNKKIKDISKVSFGMQLRNRKNYPIDVLKNPTEEELTKFHKKCYTGRNIKAYKVIHEGLYCYFNREAKRGGCWDESQHFSKNKILVSQIGKYPTAGIDKLGLPILNTAFMIVPTIKDISYSLQSIINSSIGKFFWLKKYYDQRESFPKIKGSYLKEIPVPSKITDPILHISSVIIVFISEKELIDKLDLFRGIIDGIIFEFYFPVHLKEKQINILEYVEKDLKEVLKVADFEQLSDTAKEKVVTELYERWSNPNSEIQKRMGLFKERSPDILKPILESR